MDTLNDLVTTIFGDIPRKKLDVTEKIEEDMGSRRIQTVWTLREDIVIEKDGKSFHIAFTFPPLQDSDGSPILGTERTVRSVKGEVARQDAHVMAKTGIGFSGEQGNVS